MNEENKYFVERTCTRRLDTGEQETKPLENYENLPIYVLLGEPGLGKTTAFKQEAKRNGGQYINAKFLGATLDPSKIYFIDGVDEKGQEEVINYLHEKNCHRFRLACRSAEWNREYSSLLGHIVELQLNPLTDENIEGILENNKKVSSPKKFIDAMREHHLFELLDNPLILDLLAETFDPENMPRNRKYIYKKGCEKIIKEYNKAHQSNNISNEQLINAAGYLSAIQLFSGISGFALDVNMADEQYTDVRDLKTTDSITLMHLREALKTKLFQQDGEGRRIPLHPTIAEYLGAVYLSGLVKQYLPARRILAFLPNNLGMIASPLRGLAAWLAVECSELRHELITRDPAGVMIYGDIYEFSIEDKQLILEEFKNKAQYYDWPHFEEKSFGALATKNMLDIFRQALNSQSRDIATQKQIKLLLTALLYGDHLIELTDTVENIVRDPSYLSTTRASAAGVLTKFLKPDITQHQKLRELSNDLRSGRLEDRDDEVLGELLDQLYPEIITPREILEHLHTPKEPFFWGSYLGFWYRKWLPEEMSILQSSVIQKHSELIPNAIDSDLDRLNQIFGNLLVQGLELQGDKMTIPDLYRWLDLGVNQWKTSSCLNPKNILTIRHWFQQRPDKYKALFVHAASLCADKKEFNLFMYQCDNKVQQLSFSGEWYLENAQFESEQDEKLAQYYFNYGITILKGAGKLTQEYQTSLAHNCPLFASWLLEHNKIFSEEPEWKIDYEEKMQKKKKEWEIYFRPYLLDAQNDKVPSRILYQLSQAYYGNFSDVHGDTSDKRLRFLLNEDGALLAVAYKALYAVFERKDLPTAEDVLKFFTENNIHPLCLALLIAANQLYEKDPESILNLDETILKTLLASLLTSLVSNIDEAPWLAILIKERTMLVKEIFLQYMSSVFSSKQERITSLIRLIYNEHYPELSSLLPELLAKFPLRATKRIIDDLLRPLLSGALLAKHIDKDNIMDVIDQKLAQKTMLENQKIYWMTCKFILSPSTYSSKLRNYVKKNQLRLYELSDFLQYHLTTRFIFDTLDDKTTGFLIELFAPTCSPELPNGCYQKTPEMHTADLARDLIYKLQQNINNENGELNRLLQLENLKSWHNFFKRALDNKLLAQSTAAFANRKLSVDDICNALRNGEPASPADLAAIITNELDQYSKDVKHDNADTKDVYWIFEYENDKKNKKKIYKMPLNENDCRNRLLDHLKPRLEKYNMANLKESQGVNKTRTDIIVSAHGFNIPIEVKLDENKKLWTAIGTQLKDYTLDPSTGGYGIYVVFWFGIEMTQSPPDGKPKPKTAEELQERLKATLSEQDKQRISICVIDCFLKADQKIST